MNQPTRLYFAVHNQYGRLEPIATALTRRELAQRVLCWIDQNLDGERAISARQHVNHHTKCGREWCHMIQETDMTGQRPEISIESFELEIPRAKEKKPPKDKPPELKLYRPG